MLKCVLIEDEQPARELLKNFINRIEWLELVAEFKGPLQVGNLEWLEIDILFTDIEMGEISGVSYLRTLTQAPFVIITTAYSEHAIEGYELDIVDYLVKPFPFERFLTAVNKVKNRMANSIGINSSQPEQLLLIQAEHKTYRVKPRQIVWIEGMREYARYYLTSGEKIMELISLKQLEKSLPNYFLRIHRSYIVNRNFIQSFDSVSIDLEGQKIPIGKSYRVEVKKNLRKI